MLIMRLFEVSLLGFALTELELKSALMALGLFSNASTQSALALTAALGVVLWLL